MILRILMFMTIQHDQPVKPPLFSEVHFAKCGDAERKALCVLAKVSNRSLKAHVSKHLFYLGYPSRDRGEAKKALRRVVRLGFAMRHPTAGGMTYQLTRRGLILAWSLELGLQCHASNQEYRANVRHWWGEGK